MMNVIQFPKKELCTYNAKQETIEASGYEIKIAGTLDGYIDFCITCSDGSHLTYRLTRDNAVMIIAGLQSVINDINKNCLFERDQLLLS